MLQDILTYAIVATAVGIVIYRVILMLSKMGKGKSSGACSSCGSSKHCKANSKGAC